ncbi:Hint domain-containing protein [Acidiphilium sp. AL]|uniref:Hint domain-containing protein n=1 Tax=Acidiphilium TaxID=522 RepID=UPI002915EF2E|nr:MULTISPECIES: Hint domain-containing protein [Acidiphilium]MCU4159954.1 Hint domain-containing protein [Acidiphilium sp. AL]
MRQVERHAVTYYHIELPHHAILYAEGTPAESYLETGNRDAFENGGAALLLHPDFAQTFRET